MKKALTISLFFYLFTLQGQKGIYYAPYYNFDIFTTKNGLSNNRINKIFQDKEDYLWIATENGLNKFDGYRFTNYFHNQKDSSSIAGNIVCTLAQDDKDVIWIGSNGGLDIYGSNNHKFRHIFPFKNDSLNSKSRFVMSVYCENDSIVWFDTADGLLHKYNPLTKSHKTFQHQPHIQFNTYYYHWIFDDNRGNLWIGGRGLDPCKFAKKEEKFTYYKADPDNKTRKRDKDVTKYYIDKTGVFWIAGIDGLYQFDREKEVFSKYLGGSTFDLIDFNENELWISNGIGMKILDRASGKLYSIVHSDENKRSLPSNYVFDFFKDNAGNLWIGTMGGLCKYSPYKNKFGAAFHIYGDNKTLSSDNITTIMQANDGKIWVGTKNNGIDILNEDFIRTDHIDKSKKSKYQLASNRISKLFQDSKGNIYIGLWAGIGFDFIEAKTDKLYHFSLQPVSQKYDWYNDFIEDKAGKILIGIWSSYSLGKFDPEKKEFVGLPNKPGPFIDKLGSHFINCLMQNDNGDIFIGTSNIGLSIYNEKSGKLKNFSGLTNDSIKLWGHNVTYIFKDSKNNIWVGAKGLNKYNGTDDTFEHFTKEDGLCDDGIQAILDDDEGYLWISTSNGLSKFDASTGDFQNFFEKDGLRGNEFNSDACKLDDGRLVFASKNGLVIIDSHSAIKDKFKPKVLLTGFKIFAEPQDLNKLKTGLINLKHNRNYLTFAFSSNDFSSVQDNRFAYKLGNFDDDWHFPKSGQREAVYTYLEPGEYELKLKTANMDGVWGDDIKRLNILIKPPWWKTWWFMLLEIIVLMIIVFIVIKYRENKLKEKHFTELLEQKLLRSQMNPHFIFNALGAIQSYIFTHNPIEAGTYLAKFADLMRSILYGSKEEFISLEKEIESLKNYLIIQQLRFENKFDFSFEIDPDINTEFFGVPPLLIQPFLENSIEHGFKELERKGMIRIKIKREEDKLKIVVEDNGKGIEKIKDKSVKTKDKSTKVKVSEDSSKHKSMALQIIKKRLQILNKEKSGKFDLKVENIIDKNMEIAGVRITLFVPVIYLNH